MLEGGGVEKLFGQRPFEQCFSCAGASLTHLLTLSDTEQWLADLTDVTLVSDDTFRRLDLCDSGK